jgi:Peptidase family M28/PDZ domain/PA domain
MRPMNKLEGILLIVAMLWAGSLALRNPPLAPAPVATPRLSPFATATAPDGTPYDPRDPSGPHGSITRATGVLPYDPITRLELTQHVRTLASDQMEGRRTGEPGAERAARYIEQEFIRVGLRPGGDDGSYRQRFMVRTGARLGDRNRLAWRASGKRRDLVLNRDFRPLGFSATTHRRLEGKAAFVGYGITAPKLGYDDYAGIDVEGRIVLILRFEPAVDDSLSPFSGTALTEHADLRRKVQNAHDHGAVGVILLTAAHSGPGDSLLGFVPGAAASGGSAIPAVQARYAALEPALAANQVDLVAVQDQIDTTYAPASSPLDLIVEMEVDLDPIEVEAANVVGILRGHDPDRRREAIVAGAHYDHLGFGGPESLAPDSAAIHNGADDNASGVAALIEMAAALGTAQHPVARSVVFAAFTGEELGLLGSTHYVNAPPMPLDETRAMVNLDMIGRAPRGRVFVSGVGSSPELRAIAEEEIAASLAIPVFGEGGLGPSDHTAFYSRDIPVLFFYSPPHADYHRPTDDWEKVDFESLEGVARIASRVVGRLAAGEVETIRFTRADGTWQPGAGGGEGYGSRGYGPYLGTIPDFTSQDEGVRLTGVREGSPAAAAGLKRGDVIVKWNGRSIRNLAEYAQALKSQSPGDRVELGFLRDGQEETAAAVLAERR